MDLLQAKKGADMDLTRPLQHAITIVDRWLAYNVATDQRIAGLSVGIIHEDKILHCQGYGYANLAQKTSSSESTCYRIASIAKIFTTIAILQLQEEGKLALDDRVANYQPWFSSADDQHLHSITLRHLLTHTSGLDRDEDTPHWDDFQFPALAAIQQHVAEGATVYEREGTYRIISGNSFGHLGELVRFEKEGDRANRVFVGPNASTRWDYGAL
jgi:CubicO group peptidase (beta-lactamase class C family)